MRFRPHNAVPKFKIYGRTPALLFTPQALATMGYYVDECTDEIGWLGTVEQYEGDVYLCTEVHLLQQEVNGGTTEISPTGLVAMAEEIGLDKMQEVHLWGHSHVNMGVSPSGQDESQMKLFEDNGMEWFFRIICNKKGDIGVTFFNYKYRCIVDDVPWEVYYESGVDKDTVVAEMKEKVKKKTYQCPPSATCGSEKWKHEYRGSYADDVWYGKYNTKSNAVEEKPAKGKKKNKKSAKKADAVTPTPPTPTPSEEDEAETLQAVLTDIYNILCAQFSIPELRQIAAGDEAYEWDQEVQEILYDYGEYINYKDVCEAAQTVLEFYIDFDDDKEDAVFEWEKEEDDDDGLQQTEGSI